MRWVAGLGVVLCLLLSEAAEASGAPPLRFGVSSASVPDDATPAQLQTMVARLRELRPPGADLHVKLSGEFKRTGQPVTVAGTAGQQRAFDALAAAGFPIDLVVQYDPRGAELVTGAVPGFVRYVRELVRLIGPTGAVASLQVTNEANFPTFPSPSLDRPIKARDIDRALVEGVVAADDELRRGGWHVPVGFNWFFRGPEDELFFTRLRMLGGERFARAVDWVGADFYPAVNAPPVVLPDGLPGDLDDWTAVMLTQLRHVLMPLAGLQGKPIKIIENGFDSGEALPYDQAGMLERQVRALHRLRGLFGITDYRYFNLRDASDAFNPRSLVAGGRLGLTRSDWTRKPAFGRYRALIEELTR